MKPEPFITENVFVSGICISTTSGEEASVKNDWLEKKKLQKMLFMLKVNKDCYPVA